MLGVTSVICSESGGELPPTEGLATYNVVSSMGSPVVCDASTCSLYWCSTSLMGESTNHEANACSFLVLRGSKMML